MKVIVTGGSGFVGKHVVAQLKAVRHEVKVLDISHHGIEDSHRVDLTDYVELTSALKDLEPDVVIHLAALAGSSGKGGGAESLKHPYEFIRVNVNGTLNLYEACRQLDISKVICMSSFSPYGQASCPISEDTQLHPNNPYGTSKACVEEIAKCYSLDYGIKTLLFRPPLISGEGQKEMNALREFVMCALNDKPIVILGKGEHIREFVHPLDVARAFSMSIDYLSNLKSSYDVFVLGNKPIQMIDLAKLIIERTGRGFIEFKEATGQVFDQYTDHRKIMRVLGWTPEITVEEIVARVIADIQTRLSIPAKAGTYKISEAIAS